MQKGIRHDSSYMSPRAASPDDARSITRNLRNLPVAAPIRSMHMYNNMMYTVLTHLVEIHTGHPFADFLGARIFQPLNMHSTTLQPSRAVAKGMSHRMATGYAWNKATNSHRAVPMNECPEGQGAGSVVSSADDFIRFVQALARHDKLPVTERICRHLVRLRSFPEPGGSKRPRPFTSPRFYAAGLDVYYYRGYTVVGHDGGEAGFASRFFVLPELRAGGVVMVNASSEGGGAAVVGILCRALIDALLGVDVDLKRWVVGPKRKEKRPKQGRTVKGDERSREMRNHDSQPRSGDGLGTQLVSELQIQSDKAKSDSGAEVEGTGSGISLDGYVGEYHHPGYHTLKVEIRGGKLFIDASDRSMAFTMTFEPVSADGTRFTAHWSDWFEGGDEPDDAEFVLGEVGKAARMGLVLEPQMRDKIWFERVA